MLTHLSLCKNDSLIPKDPRILYRLEKMQKRLLKFTKHAKISEMK
jgi:hypothetical protein